MSEINGAQIQPEAKQDDFMALNAQAKALQGPVRIVMGTVIRGLLVSAPGIQPAMVLNVIAWTAGHILASSLKGDLATLLQIRTALKKAFEEGIKSVSVV